MKPFFRSIIFGLFFCSSAQASTEFDGSVFVSADYFFDVEPVSIRSFFDDWTGSFHSGNTALALNEAMVGIKRNHWSLTYLYRQVAYAKFDEETAEIVYLINNKKALPVGKEYRVDLDVRSFNAKGLRVAHYWKANDMLKLEAGLSLLYGEKLLDGSLTGEVAAIGESDYDFNELTLSYYYSRDRIFSHEVAEPTGEGAAIDLKLNWAPDNDLKFIWHIHDIGGFIRWRDAPYTSAVIESDNKRIVDGYISIDPLLKGKQLVRDFTQYLPWYFDLNSEVTLLPFMDLLVDLRVTEIKSYEKVSMQYRSSHKLRYRIGYVFDVNAVALGVRGDNVIFDVSANSFSTSNAQFFSARLSYFYFF